jgi:sugar phosphate isomerase/epimerase
MNVLVTRSMWEFSGRPLEEFLDKVKAAGYDGTDIFLPGLKESPSRVADLHRAYELALFGMITSEGRTPTEHISSLERGFALASEMQPVHLNCHTGKDFFSLEENLTIFRRSLELSHQAGIPLSHETHRGRALFSTFGTRELIRRLPEIRLTADFSHWCCVHESLLENQPEDLEIAIQHSDYIHARVGFAEGPQVNDPRGPEWKAEIDAHIGWWKRISIARRAAGATALGVCPEFGAAPYMVVLPFTRQPVTDLWEITLWMKDLLRRELGGAEKS